MSPERSTLTRSYSAITKATINPPPGQLKLSNNPFNPIADNEQDEDEEAGEEMDEGSQQTPSVDETDGTPTSVSRSTTPSLLTANEQTMMPRKVQHALRKLRLAKKVLTDTSLQKEFKAVLG
jgi:hypothetical protein